MKLLRVGIKNYRSIGEDYVFLDLRRKINLLIGANNCGKSNVLHGIKLLSEKNSLTQPTSETDKHQRKSDSKIGFCFEMEADQNDVAQVKQFGTVSIEWVPNGQGLEIIRSGLKDMPFPDFRFLMPIIQRQFTVANPDEKSVQMEKNNVAAVWVQNARHTFTEIVIIPQFRRIRDGDYSLEGQGIVKLLSNWQHPDIGQDKEQENFVKIQSLLRTLLEMPNISIEIPPNQKHIIVANNGLRLPLESYGTGIHELIIIAIAVLSRPNVIFCIEEPEIHMHPLLQKRLIDFLRRETPNQYVITTHSPALIAPQDDTAVIHLRLENGVTKSRQVETTAHSLQVLHDLGVQASDLLQANSVIWVEGPSDRIYLNAWLRLIDSTLREDIDYSIMFYGGRLLSHLSMEREQSEEADDLIKLLRINQHSAILIDSDKSAPADEINKTKQRIKDECESSGVFCWITSGREIENYLPANAVAKVYIEIASEEPVLKFGKFDRLEKSLENAFASNWKSSWSYDTAKPERARAISQHLDSNSLDADLQVALQRLVAVIKHKVSKLLN